MGRKKENFWYVLVLTGSGPVFITKLLSGKMAEWKKTEKPLELGMEQAKSVATGLLMNFYTAFAICSPIELNTQPFRYKEGKFIWESKHGGKKDAE